METWMTVFLAGVGAALTLGLVAFGLQSWREGERRTARVAVGLAVIGAMLWGIVVGLPLVDSRSCLPPCLIVSYSRYLPKPPLILFLLR